MIAKETAYATGFGGCHENDKNEREFSPDTSPSSLFVAKHSDIYHVHHNSALSRLVHVVHGLGCIYFPKICRTEELSPSVPGPGIHHYPAEHHRLFTLCSPVVVGGLFAPGFGLEQEQHQR
jgi:hypothetical protein